MSSMVRDEMEKREIVCTMVVVSLSLWKYSKDFS